MLRIVRDLTDNRGTWLKVLEVLMTRGTVLARDRTFAFVIPATELYDLCYI